MIEHLPDGGQKLATTAGCAGCGACCEEIWVSWRFSDRLAMHLRDDYRPGGHNDPRTDEGWARWQANGWDDKARPGLVAHLDSETSRANAEFIDAHWTLEWSERGDNHRYTCDQYDPDTRRCLAHADRPPICRMYPWYLGPPTADSAVARKNVDTHQGAPLGCSYVADLPPTDRPTHRYLIPLEVING